LRSLKSVPFRGPALTNKTNGAPRGKNDGAMKVWIDQDLCTGDGLCTDHCPEVFTLLEDGIAYVCENGMPANDPGGPGSLVQIPEGLDSKVIMAAEDCPGECIFIELEESIASLNPG
jgi:ferredoxin